MKGGIFLLSLCILVCAVVADTSCYDDEDECVRKLRVLMMDEGMFWFGSNFVRDCPPSSQSGQCSNPDRVSRSILARMYKATDNTKLQKVAEVNNRLQLAHVTYEAPEGQYFGCGHTFEAPVVRHRLDPTSVTTLNSWSLDYAPSVRWEHSDKDDNTFYTVLVWDVGVFYLHGLYINAKGGDVSTATPIDPYHGPRNPLLRPNIYVFAVFRQTQFMEPSTVYRIMGTIKAANQGTLPFSDFAEQATAISDMVAANILSVAGDPYSMERMKNSYIINVCPNLISTSQTLKGALKGASIEAPLTPEIMTLDYTSPSYISTLTTDLAIEYFLPNDMVIDSCCVQTTYTQSLFRPDPLGDRVTRPALTSRVPRVQISPINIFGDRFGGISDKVYTLLMVDMTEAAQQKPNPSLNIHWMVKDIQSAIVGTGEQIVPYLGPNPFNDKEPRTYVFLLLQQQTPRLDTSNIKDFVSPSCPPILAGRCEAQLSTMLKAWNLQQIVGVTWFQAVQDAYARKNLYTKFMIKNMIDVCDGQPGFEDPCPEQQYCGNNGYAPAIRQSTVLAFGLLTIFTTLINFV